MRLALTVVEPVLAASVDLVLDADPRLSVAALARELARAVRPESQLPSRSLPSARPAARVPAQRPDAAADGGFVPFGPAATDADPDGPAGGAVMLRFPDLRGRGAAPFTGPRLYVDGQLVDPTFSLAESSIRDGSLVSLDSPAGCLPAEPPGIVEVRVVGGPGAGVVHRLGPGEFEIGRDPWCAVRIDDPGMPARAARVTVGVDASVTLGPFPGEPDAGTTIEREALTGTRPVAAGEQIAIGDVLLEIGAPTAPDAAVRPSDDGSGLDFNRPPRLLPPERTTSFRLPMEPSAPDRRPLPILMAVLPVIASGGMAVLFHQYYYLMFALISPLTIVGSHVSGKRQGRRTHRTQLAEYKRLRAEITAAAQTALTTERTARRADCPDPAAILLLAAGPRQRLWERRRHDPDRLLLRLGTADLPSEVTCDDPNVEEHRRESTWRAPDVPVTVSLPDRGVLGVAGRDGVARVLGCWLVAQAAVLHSPRDLSICVLTDSSGRESWEWVRWLPHTRPVDGQDTAVLLGTDADSWGRRVGELGAQIAARISARGDLPGAPTIDAPDILVVLDGARRLRSLPGMITVLRDGPAVGVFTVCLDTDERLLPEECQAVAAQTRGGRWRVGQMRADLVPDVRPDLIATGGGGAFDARAAAVWCERVARALAPVRDVGPGDDAAIPASARLLDVLGLEPPTAAAVAGRWTVAPRSTEAVVGVSLDGPFALDLRRHGPHGLIAGTTGAGKSELLQTIVAALAVANRPDAMTFVLIDYKGGSAFADCVALPHTVGMVTDLDTHLVERALASLSAELRRREHILADAGAKDIEDYTLRVAAGELAPLPRLLLVIDEFASMARELPDFVTGLVNIAQRGRSLGLHLLLATQRPSGVVSPEIRANTNLRIALRVTDTGESVDVIDAPDAGRISPSTPGRAYVRLGHGSLVPFQAGRVGGRRPVTAGAGSGAGDGGFAGLAGGAGRSSASGAGSGANGDRRGGGSDRPGGTGPDPDAPPPWFTELDWTGLSRPAPVRPRAAAAPVDEVTDLKVLVEAVREAADQLAVPAQPSPWLPALPEVVTLDDLLVAAPPARPGLLPPLLLGLSDYCDRQAQLPFALDLEHGGHLMIVGSPRSGRSTALRTLAGAIATSTSVSDVHLYGLDCGNAALVPVAGLPHCGAVATRDQPDRVGRLFTRLLAEVGRRQELFAARGFADLAEQRAAEPDDARPYLVLLLDRFEGFLASFEDTDGGALVEALLRLLREGPAAGLRVVLTADRRGLSGRLASAVEDRFVLRMADKGDYSLAGIPPNSVPDGLAPGRGYRAESGIETQIALLAADPAGRAQVAALAGLARQAAATERDRVTAGGRPSRPFRIDVLPTRISALEVEDLRAEAVAAEAEQPDLSGPAVALIGVGGDELSPLEIDLTIDGPGFVIAGPPRSGRSSALITVARSLSARGARLLVVAPRRSPVTALADQPGVLGVLGRGATAADLADATATAAADGRPLVVIADDAELLADAPLADALAEFVKDARDTGGALVAAGTTEDLQSAYRGFTVDARRSRCGVLLCPASPLEGDLFTVRLPRSTVGTTLPGRGLLAVRGQLTPIQVALS